MLFSGVLSESVQTRLPNPAGEETISPAYTQSADVSATHLPAIQFPRSVHTCPQPILTLDQITTEESTSEGGVKIKINKFQLYTHPQHKFRCKFKS